MKNNCDHRITTGMYWILPAVIASTGIFSLRGISLYTLSLVLFVLVQSFSLRRCSFDSLTHLQIIAGLLFAASAFYGGDNVGVSLLYATIFITVLSTSDQKSRILAFIPIIPLFWLGSISGIIPAIAGLALTILFGKSSLRYGIFAAGCIAGVIIFGIPSATHYKPVFPEYEVKYERFDWHDSICVNLSHPELVFEVPDRFTTDKRLYIQLRTGGVRDDLPVGIIEFNGISERLSIGIDTLEFTPDVDRITVSLLREWQPFNHPVIWIGRIWQD